MQTPLFVTRKFPPAIGGMETLSETVWLALKNANPEASLIAYSGKGKARLLLWLIRTAAQVFARSVFRRDSMVLVGDAVTFAALAPALMLTRTAHVTMVMGLDLVYPNFVYRHTVVRLLRRADRVLAISRATRDQARDLGIPADRLGVMRLGVSSKRVTHSSHSAARSALLKRWQLPSDAKVLLTIGRLVRRKGARWFVSEVLPNLEHDVHYVVAGSGPDRDEISRAARTAGVEGRVHLIGQISDEHREELLTGADIFIQPNIAVPGDMEGFGLVTIEAAHRNLLVLAADLEGLRDAVVDGATGVLLPSSDVLTWTRAVTSELGSRATLTERGKAFGANARELYSLESMTASLLPELDRRRS